MPTSTISLEHERSFGEDAIVMGIDEAGRGPLAGPVFAAAVSLPLDRAADLLAGDWKAVNDSKKLSPARRDTLADVIKSTPGSTFAIASASALEIDQLNILHATHLAMRRAALSLAEQLQRETQAKVELKSMQAVFPTTTKFGMAALLPHKHIYTDYFHAAGCRTGTRTNKHRQNQKHLRGCGPSAEIKGDKPGG